MLLPLSDEPQSPADATWSVPHEWEGETAFLVGGGPSLIGFDPARLAGLGRVIAINRMVLPFQAWPGLPTADVMYFCDASFWHRDGAAIRAFYRGPRIVTLARLPNDPDLLRLTRHARLGLSSDPRQLCHGANSGYQAINLAYLFGAARIVLLGFDLKVSVSTGRTHAHGGYLPPNHSINDRLVYQGEVSHQLGQVHLPKFATLQDPLALAGVEVINASPHSALDVWPRMSIDEALAAL
jgi:hypothetical protein